MKELGRGFMERKLANMVRSAEVLPDANIVHALRAKLSWSHFRRRIYLEDSLKREFYAGVESKHPGALASQWIPGD